VLPGLGKGPGIPVRRPAPGRPGRGDPGTDRRQTHRGGEAPA